MLFSKRNGANLSVDLVAQGSLCLRNRILRHSRIYETLDTCVLYTDIPNTKIPDCRKHHGGCGDSMALCNNHGSHLLVQPGRCFLDSCSWFEMHCFGAFLYRQCRSQYYNRSHHPCASSQDDLATPHIKGGSNCSYVHIPAW